MDVERSLENDLPARTHAGRHGLLLPVLVGIDHLNGITFVQVLAAILHPDGNDPDKPLRVVHHELHGTAHLDDLLVLCDPDLGYLSGNFGIAAVGRDRASGIVSGAAFGLVDVRLRNVGLLSGISVARIRLRRGARVRVRVRVALRVQRSGSGRLHLLIFDRVDQCLVDNLDRIRL